MALFTLYNCIPNTEIPTIRLLLKLAKSAKNTNDYFYKGLGRHYQKYKTDISGPTFMF